MIKVICDICNKEINENELQGGLMREKFIYPMMPGKEGPVGPVGPTGKMRDKEVWTLCENCSSELVKEVDRLKKKKKS